MEDRVCLALNLGNTHDLAREVRYKYTLLQASTATSPSIIAKRDLSAPGGPVRCAGSERTINGSCAGNSMQLGSMDGQSCPISHVFA
jgi:hypothetical protein